MMRDAIPFLRVTMTPSGPDAAGIFAHTVGQARADQPPEKRAGSWAEWRWDGERLQVRNDWLGFVPLFYACWDGSVAVSPSLVKLVEHGAPTDIDGPALAAFLRLGFFLGEDTPFTAIRALPPGAVLEWRGGSMDLRSPKLSIARPSDLSRDEAINAYIELFRAAVRRRLPGREDFVLPLSAGRDSRYILLELYEAGCRPKECLTLVHPPPRPNHDVRVARMLARELGISHVVLPQTKPRLEAELQKNVLTHFCADEHAWYLPMADYLRAQPSLIYDGLAGDTLARPHTFPRAKQDDFLRRDVHEQARMLCGPNAYLDRLVSPGQKEYLGDDVAMERIAAELHKHQQAPNMIGSFYFWNRTRREIALSTFSILSPVTAVHTPYLDPEIVRHLSSLPVAYLIDDRFRTDVLKRAHPKYAHLPFEGQGVLSQGLGRRLRAGLSERTRAMQHFGLFAAQLIRYARAVGPSHFVDRSYLVPKLVLDLARWSGAEIEKYGPLALYLLQLENVARMGR